MLWVVQKDLRMENRRGSLPECLERLGIDYVEVEVSGNRIEPDVNPRPGEAVICNGSVMLSNIARAKGWLPGSFLNENYDFGAWGKMEAYGQWALNKDARVCLLKDARVAGERVFARPVLDNKSFNGRVFERAEFEAFQKACMEGKPGHASPEIEILTAAPKAIGQEHRHYIVDGVVVSSSRYKFAGTPNFAEGADESVLAVAREAIARWTPARAFVMDTYVAGDDVGIVEIGGICHAGVYEADIMKIACALDSMPLDRAACPGKPSKRGPV
jgi:hypothetical protein